MRLQLPELGEGVHEGELVKWRVKPGDQVADDQPLCEIMTDKATIELPSSIKGKVTELFAKEGDIVHVGQDLLGFEGVAGAAAHIAGTASASTPAAAPAAVAANAGSLNAQAPKPGGSAGSAPVASVPMSAAPAGSAARTASAAQSTPQAASLASGDLHTRVAAAPSTRRTAREMGVDLSQIQGTGPNGRIMREDLEHGGSMGNGATAAGSPQLAKGAPGVRRAPGEQIEERIPFRGLRRKISEKMRLSKDKAAHFTYVEEADMTEMVALRNQAKDLGAKQGVKVTYLPFLMKAMVSALRKYPILNSSLDEATNEIVLKHYFNIGLSIQTEDGLTAPVIKDVANKSIFDLAREIQDVVERARAKKLAADDFHNSTITLTNAGSIGGLFATPVINFPEVAILGFNKIARKPVVKSVGGKEEIVIRDWTYFSISLDHRIVDGAIGAEFMKLFIQYVETPSLLLLESV